MLTAFFIICKGLIVTEARRENMMIEALYSLDGAVLFGMGSLVIAFVLSIISCVIASIRKR